MKVLIVIIILAIVAFGLYRTSKIDDETTGVTGGAGVNHGHEYTGDEKKPRPDDEEHDDDVTHE